MSTASTPHRTATTTTSRDTSHLFDATIRAINGWSSSPARLLSGALLLGTLGLGGGAAFARSDCIASAQDMSVWRNAAGYQPLEFVGLCLQTFLLPPAAVLLVVAAAAAFKPTTTGSAGGDGDGEDDGGESDDEDDEDGAPRGDGDGDDGAPRSDNAPRGGPRGVLRRHLQAAAYFCAGALTFGFGLSSERSSGALLTGCAVFCFSSDQQVPLCSCV